MRPTLTPPSANFYYSNFDFEPIAGEDLGLGLVGCSSFVGFNNSRVLGEARVGSNSKFK